MMRTPFALALFAAAMLAACTTPQIHSNVQVRDLHLATPALAGAGIAFVTPSSVTGQEEDRQALAFAFFEVFKQDRPELRVVALPDTLSAINRAGLTNAYRHLADDYRVTGIFSGEVLGQIAQAAGVRYIAQLKLGGFRQESRERWGVLGVRVFETKTTTLRLFLQIWDSHDGSVAWEGSEELTVSKDSVAEAPISLHDATVRAARELVARMP